MPRNPRSGATTRKPVRGCLSKACTIWIELKKIDKRKKYIETNYSILGGFFTNSRLDGGKQGEEVLISREDPHWNEYGHTVVANNIYRFLNNE